MLPSHRDKKKSYDQRKLTEDHALTIECSIKWKRFEAARSKVINARNSWKDRNEALELLKSMQAWSILFYILGKRLFKVFVQIFKICFPELMPIKFQMVLAVCIP